MASPAIAQARIKTNKEQIRRLENELAELRKAVVTDEKVRAPASLFPGRLCRPWLDIRARLQALIWRVIAFANTATVSGILSGSAGVASKIASSDAIFKTTLMVFYDQFWNRIDWGKELENVDGDGI